MAARLSWLITGFLVCDKWGGPGHTECIVIAG